jgi:hypothetical protein
MVKQNKKDTKSSEDEENSWTNRSTSYSFFCVRRETAEKKKHDEKIKLQ